jgi:hypothetical protein
MQDKIVSVKRLIDAKPRFCNACERRLSVPQCVSQTGNVRVTRTMLRALQQQHCNSHKYIVSAEVSRRVSADFNAKFLHLETSTRNRERVLPTCFSQDACRSRGWRSNKFSSSRDSRDAHTSLRLGLDGGMLH